jgi:hypothetical protein
VLFVVGSLGYLRGSAWYRQRGQQEAQVICSLLWFALMFLPGETARLAQLGPHLSFRYRLIVRSFLPIP